MKAYCNIISGKVMLSKLPKPDEKDFSHDGCKHVKPKYIIALSEFSDSIIGEAENVFYCHLNKKWCISAEHPEYRKELQGNNQPCEVEQSGDKYTITKI